MINKNSNKSNKAGVALILLVIIIFLLALIAVAAQSKSISFSGESIFGRLFTGAGTVGVAIIGYLAKEFAAVSADNRKLEFEIGKETRKQEQEIRISRITLLAEFTSLKKMAASELHFVLQHTDPKYRYYIRNDELRSPGTEVPVIGFFQDFDKFRVDVSQLTSEESRAAMSAYFNYVERRNYILKNSKLKSADYAQALRFGSAPYSFEDPFFVGCLRSELGAMRNAAKNAVLVIRKAETEARHSMKATS